MKPEVISEQPLSMSEVRKELKKVAKRDEELSFRSAKADEYLKELTLLSDKSAKDLKKKLQGLEIPRLKEEHIAKIIDLLPHTKEDLRLILSGYTLTIKDENVKRLLEAIKEFR
jgi:DNA-directed RNA polymerase subunit F